MANAYIAFSILNILNAALLRASKIKRLAACQPIRLSAQ
jgi:hypothetical protein